LCEQNLSHTPTRTCTHRHYVNNHFTVEPCPYIFCLHLFQIFACPVTVRKFSCPLTFYFRFTSCLLRTLHCLISPIFIITQYLVISTSSIHYTCRNHLNLSLQIAKLIGSIPNNFLSLILLFLDRLFLVNLIKWVLNVRMYVHPSTKRFFDFSKIWHVARH